MAEWTADDIEETRALLAILKQSATEESFEKAASAYEALCVENLKAQHRAEINQRIAASYQALLSAFGGNTDYLAKMLYAYHLETMHRLNNANADHHKSLSAKTGRPPDKWGNDAAGKLMLYFCIEEIMQKMRDEGIRRPKIKDAVARGLGISAQQRGRISAEAKIKDHASRYSEAKKILKGHY